MSRIARTSVVSPKVYRHFAVITIAITACLALFANGEGTEGLSAQIEARQARNALLTAEADKLGARRFKAGKLRLRDEKRSHLAFAPDEGSDVRNQDSRGDFDGGDESAAFAPSLGPEGTETGAGGASGAIPDLPPVLPPGVSAAEREKAEFTRRQAQRAPAVTKPSAAQIEAMLAASRARSGSAGND